MGREAVGEAQPLGAAALEEGHQGEDEQDAELGQDEDGEDLGAHLDPGGTEDLDDHHGDQDPDPPRCAQPRVLLDQATDDEAVQAVHGGLDRTVGEERDSCAPGADGAAEPLADVDVEGAGVHDMSPHGDEADGEQQDDGADRGIRGGRTRAVANGDGDGHGTGYAGQRRLRGENEEEDSQNTEGVGFESACGGGALHGLCWFDRLTVHADHLPGRGEVSFLAKRVAS